MHCERLRKMWSYWKLARIGSLTIAARFLSMELRLETLSCFYFNKNNDLGILPGRALKLDHPETNSHRALGLQSVERHFAVEPAHRGFAKLHGFKLRADELLGDRAQDNIGLELLGE